MFTWKSLKIKSSYLEGLKHNLDLKLKETTKMGVRMLTMFWDQVKIVKKWKITSKHSLCVQKSGAASIKEGRVREATRQGHKSSADVEANTLQWQQIFARAKESSHTWTCNDAGNEITFYLLSLIHCKYFWSKICYKSVKHISHVNLSGNFYNTMRLCHFQPRPKVKSESGKKIIC